MVAGLVLLPLLRSVLSQHGRVRSSLFRKLLHSPVSPRWLTLAIQEDKSATLSCNNDQTLFVPTQTENGEVIYLARKLTPTECASLQGFEKDWCALVPHKDSAEYKMWGNGMAFPCMLYIMEGVQEVLAERYLDNLFGGDTAEP